MIVVVAYDVSTESPEGRRRLRKVADACQAYGQRVQKSVFECSLSETQLLQLENRLLGIVNLTEDRLRIYRLLEPRGRYIRIHGKQADVDFKAPLIV